MCFVSKGSPPSPKTLLNYGGFPPLAGPRGHDAAAVSTRDVVEARVPPGSTTTEALGLIIGIAWVPADNSNKRISKWTSSTTHYFGMFGEIILINGCLESNRYRYRSVIINRLPIYKRHFQIGYRFRSSPHRLPISVRPLPISVPI